MSEITANTIVRVAPSALAERLGEEMAILDPNSGMYFGLNEVGSRIWELIKQPKSLHDVAAVIANEYEVEAGRCQADILSLVGRMAQVKLVEVVDGKG